ncbi:MAG: 2-isopropylmalate synthase [Erysipelotrichaceae bacterium]|nr:2-isopropylmalate synthase [Erysipelotrichaceae bacterium]
MMNANKYSPGYFPVEKSEYRWVKKDHPDQAPIWCSVDLRDGNQALIVPMSLEEKLEFFNMLVKIGFKEIEVGFPAASETEYEFLRTLIEQDLIPDDVTIQVLTQCREHIIRKTFDAIQGAPRAVVHFYNSTSKAQREQVFKKSKDEIKEIALEGARLVKQLSQEYEGNFLFEYSPESFTGTEPDYALEVCNAVIDIMEPTVDRPMIINLPVTVEMSLPHVYANQIEYCSDRLHRRDAVILSTHPHNDRGTGVADTELALLAGAQRVECCLFGNGERTGNVDAITLALNLYVLGVDPKLDFSNMPEIVEIYERTTRMHVHERQPYAGSLVFAAFSGSHQDAIAKGMKCKEEDPQGRWTVPYLPIDPLDLSRTYDADVIRVNSQSGKGGIGYILEHRYGYDLPAKMREHFGYTVKSVSDHCHAELKPEEILEVFKNTYLNKTGPIFEMKEAHFIQGKTLKAVVTVMVDGQEHEWYGVGNGRLNAVNNALKQGLNLEYSLETYTDQSLGKTSDALAQSYIGLLWPDGSRSWGAGSNPDILYSAILALTSAINNRNQ